MSKCVFYLSISRNKVPSGIKYQDAIFSSQINVMSINRVQKLLFSEYCDFEDMVLIESPFAQTTKGGQGLRQVYLGKYRNILQKMVFCYLKNPVNSVEH